MFLCSLANALDRYDHLAEFTLELSSVATLKCTDVGTGDEALVIVRAGPEAIGIALSLLGDGDVEVMLSLEDARRARAALDLAIERSNAART
jgi:hypothetical protein